MYDEGTVKSLLETAINSLVDNFAKEPYLHRVEHSVHCELYSMLNVHRALQGTYKLEDSERSTSLIHKEWPETNARKGRRGNFDLAILSPLEISKHTLNDFTEGFIVPDFVIEMGLNYPLKHLEDDHSKIRNSKCMDNGYLVHLWQPHNGITKKLPELINWCKKNHNNLAAAVFDGKDIWIKHLSDLELKKVRI